MKPATAGVCSVPTREAVVNKLENHGKVPKFFFFIFYFFLPVGSVSSALRQMESLEMRAVFSN